jgi:hypothetical protein
MTKYDKELDTRTDEYEEAIEPLDEATRTEDERRDEDVEDGD